jgi:hypothetical protein
MYPRLAKFLVAFAYVAGHSPQTCIVNSCDRQPRMRGRHHIYKAIRHKVEEGLGLEPTALLSPVTTGLVNRVDRGFALRFSIV